jgi:hypothetical protein
MPATAARCGRAPASRRAAISVSAGVRTLTTTAWARVALDDHRDGQPAGRHLVSDAAREHTAVRLQLFGDNVRDGIEVWDAESRPPAPRDPGQDGIPDVEGEGGRELFLVAALSACWDWYLTQEPAGKVVWCELEAERPELSEVGGPASPLLQRRMPRQVQVRPVAVMNDPDILCRIRDGLRDLSDC